MVCGSGGASLVIVLAPTVTVLHWTHSLQLQNWVPWVYLRAWCGLHNRHASAQLWPRVDERKSRPGGETLLRLSVLNEPEEN